MGHGPAAFIKQADEDVRMVREWATDAVNDWAKGEDEAEVLQDCYDAYIDTEIGDESHPRAKELRRRLGL